MNKKLKKTDRLKKLKASIQFFYGELDCEEIDKLRVQYEHSITEMFQVIEVQKDSLTLMHFFNNELYGPLMLPESFTSLVEVNDVFLITMGLENEAWHPIYISNPYDCPGT